MRLRNSWSYLAQLHGFHHSADLPEARFLEACLGAGVLLDLLNPLLPEPLRLPPASYAWLVTHSS